MSEYSPKAQQTRERILRAAVELFYQQGYNATGLESVISAAGVVKGNFYYYFKSKEELAVEALRWQRQQTRNALGIDLPLADETPLQRLFNILQRMKHAVAPTSGEQCEIRGCYYGNLALELSASSESVRQELISVFEGIRALFADLIHQARERGEISATIDPDNAATMLLSLIEGAVLLSKTTQNTQEIDKAIEFIRNYLAK